MDENVNLTNSIMQSINEIFSNIFSSIDNNIYEILDKITFIDTGIIEKENFIKLLCENGILLVCNALVLGIVIFYVCSYLFSHITYSKVQSPMQFLFKSIIFVAIMNSSYWICTQIISINSLVTEAICDIGKSLFGEDISFINFITKINDSIYLSDIDVISFNGIIKFFSTVGFMNLIFTYSLRYVMIQVFVLIFPFSILCLINLKTEWIFKSLMKAFIFLLLEQVLIAIILVLEFSFSFLDNDIMSKVIYIGIIYALMKANTYMYMIFGGITTSISNNFNMLTNKNVN